MENKLGKELLDKAQALEQLETDQGELSDEKLDHVSGGARTSTVWNTPSRPSRAGESESC